MDHLYRRNIMDYKKDFVKKLLNFYITCVCFYEKKVTTNSFEMQDYFLLNKKTALEMA